MTPHRMDDRPLSARSVVASTLLGMHPPVLPARVLVRSGELFGIAEGTTRTALSRMVAAGELEAEDSSYRLAGRLLERQARQDVSRKRARWGWDGRWWRMAVVVADRRSPEERAGLRASLLGARYAELREGVWTRPDNLPGDRPPAPGCEWIKGEFAEPAQMAATLWDLEGWAVRARGLQAAVEDWTPRLAGEGVAVLAPTFVVSADVLRHLQADPLLPRELLPDGWPGESLRAAYDTFDAAFQRAWRDWYRSVR
ncbi:MAG TPA: PaaX family transcriptional regulator C-terminal domain-containing protein [Acidimicrobiales bacterium]|nr:PaaX family transcriptional regulator C-terminal domain-containing protein [Acidimicrobiales bacterium]